MKLTYLFLTACHALLTGCSTPSSSHKTSGSSPDSTVYGRMAASTDGIGKTYLGREIAHVMGFGGAGWLERDERQEEENTALAIGSCRSWPKVWWRTLGPVQATIPFGLLQRYPRERCIAVDVQDESVTFLRNKAQELGMKNVEVVKGGAQSPNLPDNTVDLAIMVDVYHELEYPHEMLQAIRKSLKPDGKILLLEYRAEDPTIPIKKLHKLSVAQAYQGVGGQWV